MATAAAAHAPLLFTRMMRIHAMQRSSGRRILAEQNKQLQQLVAHSRSENCMLDSFDFKITRPILKNSECNNDAFLSDWPFTLQHGQAARLVASC